MVHRHDSFGEQGAGEQQDRSQQLAGRNDSEAVPLSALQHWAYCPRQCGLIHLDQAFDENLHTLRGRALHQRVDQPGVDTQKGRRLAYAVPLWHDGLGLVGKADVVEFAANGTPYPVEYKLGSRHKAAAIAACDEVQLAAQAMCLAHMTGLPVAEGAIFYAASRRRHSVAIDEALRQRVAETAAAVRSMLNTGQLPPPLDAQAAQQRCGACSLRDRCMPLAWQDERLASARAGLFDPDA